ALNEYRLSLTLARNNDRVVSECSVVVRSAAGAPGATATRPAAATTPGTQAAGTPAPVRTGTVTTGAPAPAGSTATRVP
ncbi:MAG TPA: hypothetical protein VJB57_02475, partial [Dehalococcoidia bacterium]|nr:hypothetical protein [Dehalococcoidia bacterium]